MPDWAGRWKGGRYYLDDQGRRVFFIERRVEGRQRGIKLGTHDPDLALGELARFEADPTEFVREPEPTGPSAPVTITAARVALYLDSIHATVADHRAARRSQLHAWSELGLDLRTVTRQQLRAGLASFEGGHRGRTEALNAFGRFLVREGELAAWNPLVNTREAEATRAEREAYSIEALRECWARLPAGAIRDVFHLRAATGMHHTEIEQLEGCRIYAGPLPDKGVGIRRVGLWCPKCDGHHVDRGEWATPAKAHHKHLCEHCGAVWDVGSIGVGSEIAGVIQVMHKSRRRHRQPVDAAALAAALRLRERVPGRVHVWEALKPLVPSNLRHTFVTLAGEVGELVTWVAGGVDRGRIAQAVGHRAGSTMTADRYDKLQVPPMIRLPLGFGID